MALTKPRAAQLYDIDYKQAALVVTTTNIALVGGAPNVVDGTALAQNSRVLVAGQSIPAQNGIYTVTTLGTGTSGTWTRSQDATVTGQLLSGTIITVTEGVVNKDTQWMLTTDGVITIGTTPIQFSKFSDKTFSEVDANGVVITATSFGDTLNILPGNNISVLGDASSKTITISATIAQPSQIINGTSRVYIPGANSNVAISVGAISNAAVFSPTGLGLIGSISATGNAVIGGNLTVGGTYTAGNIVVGNITIPYGGYIVGDLVPAIDSTFSLGNITNKWKDLWLSNSTLYIGNTTVSTNSTGQLTVNGNTVVTAAANGMLNVSNIAVTDTIFASNIYVSNANRDAVVSSDIVIATEVIGNLLIGNGAFITDIYSNANVANYLATYSGPFGNGDIELSAANINANGYITSTSSITGASLVSNSTITAAGAATAQSIVSNTTVSAASTITAQALVSNSYIAATSTIVGQQIIGNVAISTPGTMTGGDIISNNSITAAGIISGLDVIGSNSVVGQTIVSNTSVIAEDIISNDSIIAVGDVIADALYANNHIFAGNTIATASSVIGHNFIANESITAGDFIDSQSSITGQSLVSNTSVTGQTLSIAQTGSFGNSVSISGDIHVAGNAYVEGNVTYINIEELSVQDPIISMGRGPNNTPLTANDGYDRGEQMWYYNTANASEQSAFIGYQNSTGKLFAATNVTIANEIVTVNNYGNFVLGNIESLSVVASGNITGGNIIAANNIISNGAANIAGDLIVNGDNTYINSTLDVQDPIIGIGRGPNGSPLTSSDAYDRGEQIWYYDVVEAQEQSAFIGYDAGNRLLMAASNVTISSGNIVTVNDYGNIRFGNVIASNVDASNINISNTLSVSSLSVPGMVECGNIISNTDITVAGSINGAQIFASSANVSGVANVNELISQGGVTAVTLDITGDTNLIGNANIDSNLTVNGTDTYLNSDTLGIYDRVIGIGRDANYVPLSVNDARDRGEQLWYYSVTANTEQSAFIGYDASANKLLAAIDVTVANNIVTVVDYGNIVLGNVEVNDVIVANNISVASLTVPGNVTANNLIATNNIVAGGFANVTGTIVGGSNLLLAGTANIQGNANVVGNLGVSNTLTVSKQANFNANINVVSNIVAGNTTIIGNADIGNVNVANSISVSKNANIVGNLTVTGKITGGNDFVLTGNANIGSNATVTGNIAANYMSINHDVTIGGNALIVGNAIIDGDVTYINITDYNVQDPIISLGTGANGSPLTFNDGKDRGENMVYYRSGQKSAFIGYDESANTLTAAIDVTITNEVVSVNAYGDFVVGNVFAANITGSGNIDGNNVNVTNDVVIGNSLTVSGPISMTGPLVADSVTSNTTISAVGNVTGGNLVTANLVQGSNLYSTATITAAGNVSGGNLTTTGNAVATGNLVAGANLIVNGIATVTGNIAGGNITTTGNVVASGNVNATSTFNGANLNITNTANIGNAANVVGRLGTGSLVVETNANIVGTASFGGNISTGANAIIAGYANVGGNINGGANLNIPDNIYANNIFLRNSVFANANVTAGNLISNARISGVDIAISKDANIVGNLTIGGNLVVDGGFGDLNVTSLVVEDPIVLFGGGPNNAPLANNDGKDRGTGLNYFNAGPKIAFFGYDTSNTEIVAALDVTIANEVVTYHNYGTFRAGNIAAQSATVSGNIVAVGNVAANNVNVSANVNTANLYATGNANVIGNLDVNGNLNAVHINASGNLAIDNLFSNTVTSNGNISGSNLNASGNVVATGNIQTSSGILATGNIKGANLISTGNTISMGNVVANLSLLGNGLAVTGNANIIGTANVQGELSVTDLKVANSANLGGANLVTTGNISGNNLTISRVANIGGNVNIGGNANIANDIYANNAYLRNFVYANANVVAGNLISNANITGGNISVTKDATIGGNLVIVEDLIVNGNTTYINIVDYNVQDPIISLGGGPNGTPLTLNDGKDRGENMIYYRGGQKSAFVGYDNSANTITAAIDVSIANEVVTVNNYGDFVVGNLFGANITANGNATIGGTATIGGDANVAGDVNSNNLSTTNDANIGGDLTVTGVLNAVNVNFSGDLAVDNLRANTVTANANITGGNLISNALVRGSNLYSTATITAVGNVSGGNITTSGNVDTTNTFNGANLVLSGRANIAGAANVAGQLSAASLQVQTTANVGGVANVVGNIVGGANAIIAGYANVGGNINGGANLNLPENIYANNIFLRNNVFANANVTAGNLVSNALTTTVNLKVTSDSNIVGNEVIGGNLAVSGENTYLNTTNILITDPIVGIGRNANNAPLTTGSVQDRGSQLWYFNTTEKSAFVGFDQSANALVAALDVTIAGEVVTVNDYGKFIAGNVEATSATVTGNVAAGNVTTTGNVVASGNIDANNMNVTNDANVLGDMNVVGTLTAGTVAFTGNLDVNVLNANSINANSNITGGNLITSNAVIGSNLYSTAVIVAVGNIAGGNLVTANTISGKDLTLSGNANIAGYANVVGPLSATSLQVHTNANVAGVANVVGNIIGGSNAIIAGYANVGGNVNVSGNANIANDIYANNAYLRNFVYANANVVAGNLISNANISGGNILINRDAQVVGNLIVDQDLVVNGNTTYINIVDYNVQDPIISLGGGPNGAPLTSNDGKDRGENMIYYRGGQKSAFVGYDDSANTIVAAIDVSIANEVVTVNSYGDFVVGNLFGANLTANGNATIGGTATIGGDANVTGNVNSNNLSTVTDANIGGDLTVTGVLNAGHVNFSGDLAVDDLFANTVTANANITGGNLISNALVRGSNLFSSATITAVGNVSGGNITTSGNVDTTNTFNGANLRLSGNANIAGSANIVGPLSATTLQVHTNANVAGVANVVGNIVGGANAIIAGYANVGGNINGGANLNLVDDIYANNAYLRNFVYANANVTAGNLVSNALTTTVNLKVTNDSNIVGNEVIGGNIVVSGDHTYLNTTNVLITDPIVGIGRNANNAPLTAGSVQDRGSQLWYFNATEKSAFMGYDQSANALIAAIDVSIAGEIVTVNDYGKFIAGNVEAAKATISGNVAAGNVTTTGNVVASGNVGANNMTVTNDANVLGDMNVVGTLTAGTVAFSGNLDVDVLNANSINANSNITGGNLITSNAVIGSNLYSTATITAVGNIAGGNLVTSNTISGKDLVLTGNANVAGYANIVGPLSATSLQVHTNANVAGVANVVGNIVGGANAIIAGYANVGGNINGGANLNIPDNIYANNIFLRNNVFANANVTAGNLISNANITGGNILVNRDAQVTGNLIIGQDLIVDGNTTYINIVDYNVQDPIISLGGGPNGAPLTLNDGKDRGENLVYYRGGSQRSAFIGYDESANTITAAIDVTIANEIVSVNSYGAFVVGDVYANTVRANGNITTTSFFVGDGSHLGLDTFDGNIIPSLNVTYSLGNATNQWKDLWVSNSTIYINSIPLSIDANTDLTFNGDTVVAIDPATKVTNVGNIVVPGNVSAGNLNATTEVRSANITATNTMAAAFFAGDGSQLFNLDPQFSNANVTAGNLFANGNIGGGNLALTGTANVAGDANVLGDFSTQTLTTHDDATFEANVDVSGNISGNNLAISGVANISGNINGGSNLVLNDDIYANNAYLRNFVFANANVRAGNLISNALTTTVGLRVTSDANISGNGVIGGNITTSGQLAYINATTVSIVDPIVSFGRNANNAVLTAGSTEDRGTRLWYFSGASEKSAFMGYDQSTQKLLAATDVSITNEIVTVNNYGNFLVGNLDVNDHIVAVGNISGNNIRAANNMTALGNISGNNLSVTNDANIGGDLNVVGTLTANIVQFSGNLDLDVINANTINANGNITGGNLISNDLVKGANLYSTGLVTAVGNVAGGNVTTSGNVVATGNIEGNNLLINNFANINGGANITGPVDVVTLDVVANTNIGGSLDVTGNIDGNNLSISTYANVGGNIHGGANIILDDDIYANNAYLRNNVFANTKITGGNILSNSGVTAQTLDIVTNASVTGNLTVGGNLDINGNLIYVDVETLAVQDPIISEGRGPNNTPLTANDNKDRGLQMYYFNNIEKSAFVGFDNSANDMILAQSVTIANEIVTVDYYGNIIMGNIFASNADITNNVVVGGNLAVSREIYGNGNIFIDSNGTFGGEMDVAGNSNVGGDLVVVGNITCDYLIPGNLTLANIVSNNMWLSGFAQVAGNLSSLNFTTPGNINANGNISGNMVNGTTFTVGANGSIQMNAASWNPPTTGLRSSGTRIVYSPDVSATTADFAVGMQAYNATEGAMWHSVGSSADAFLWYAASTEVGRLTGNGNLTVTNVVMGTSLMTTGNALSITGNVIKSTGANIDIDPVGGGAADGNVNVLGNLYIAGQTTFANILVSGWANIEGNTVLGDAATDTVTINANTVSIPNNLNFDSSTLFIDATNNRVGMGTNAPGNRLDVAGNAYVSTNLVVDGWGNIAGNANIGGNANIAGNAIVGANTIISGNANVTGNIFTSANLQSTNNLIVGGNATLGGNLLITGNIIPSANNTFTLGNATNQWDEVYIAANTLFFNSLPLKVDGNTDLQFNNDTVVSVDPASYLTNVGNLVVPNTVTMTNAVVNGNTTLGDAAADVLTINGNSVAIPNSLYFDTNTLVIDATNNRVGINTTAPGNALDVTGTAYVGTDVVVGGTANATTFITTGNVLNISGNVIKTSGTNDIYIDPRGGGPTDGNVFLQGNLQVTGNLTSVDFSSAITANLVWQSANGAINAAAASGAGLAVGNVGAEYAKWTWSSTSNTWVSTVGANFAGTMNATGNVIGGNVTTAGIANIGTLAVTANAQVASLGVGLAASGVAGEILANAGVYAFSPSDARFKENVVEIDNASNIVSNIGGNYFDWTDEFLNNRGGEDGFFKVKHDFGVIAQNVQKVFPLAVRTREDGTLAVDYQKLPALAFAAIKELNEKLTAQEEIIADLISRIEKLESKK